MAKADSDSDSGFTVERSSGRRPRRLRELDLQLSFVIEQFSGSLVTSFAGTSDPFCSPLDSCGIQGFSVYSMSAGPLGTSLYVSAQRVLGRHERPTLASAIRDLRAGRLKIESDFNEETGALGQVTSRVQRSNGSSCVDPGVPATVGLKLERRRAGTRFILGPPDDDGPDVFRTHCQGPDRDDILRGGSLATGTVPLADLLRKRFHVRLTPRSWFGSTAYAGSRSGSIELDVERTDLRAHVYPLFVS
jgi:hypothetical protein